MNAGDNYNRPKVENAALVKFGYMLESLEDLELLWYNVTIDMYNIIPSDKASSADNQQERLKTINWVVGFVDGEGCFSVSIIKNSTTKTGWQIFPEFVITQGEKSLSVLNDIKEFFRCGRIFVNRRKDNHKENLYRYCVRSINDLREIIIPFFLENRLKTAKKNDFDKFVQIINLMENKLHLDVRGMVKIALIIQEMNHHKPSRFLESSETIRQTLKLLNK